MKTSKPLIMKRLGKKDREQKILLGVVDHFIKTGKPVGSNTLKEAGFEEMSSATIRNYFAHLEEEGYLTQSHSSGGRVPTAQAYRFYADTYIHSPIEEEKSPFASFQEFDSREIALFLQGAAESLSKETNCAVFLTAPRFDHDYVIDIKLVTLDAFRCLCILITDFGVIRTEVLHVPRKISSFTVKRMEKYFYWRLTGLEQPEQLEPEEEALAQSFYNELMLRYIVGYSNFIDEDVYRTGFSKLLTHADFQDAAVLASGLSLFENVHSMRLLLKECKAFDCLKCWIGEDLAMYTSNPHCTVLAIPYYIHQKAVGAVGILGPTRLPYRDLFHALHFFSKHVSESLTKNIYKFKIQFRQPDETKIYLQKEEQRLLGQSRLMLIEDKPNSTR